MTISALRTLDPPDTHSTAGSADIVSAQPISFTRTVDRTLTHRHSVSEVFVTDLAAADEETTVDEQTFVAGAQLPRSHPYFLDTADPTGWPTRYDLLLLAECSRQACTYLAHTRYDVPIDAAFLPTRSVFRLTDGPALRVGNRPAELAMVIRTGTRFRGDALHMMRSRVDYVLRGEVVAHSAGGVRFVPPAHYQVLRIGDRTDTLPSSNTLRRRGVPVPPALVGRSDPRNVVLADAAPIDGGIAARVDVAGTHPTIFDHPQDHYPAMLLAEAAAQAAALATRRMLRTLGARDPQPRVVQLDSGFTRFAELDADLGVEARVADSGPGPVTVSVSFVQHGASVAAVLVTLDAARS